MDRKLFLRGSFVVLILASSFYASGIFALDPRGITLNDRLQAQEAIERVYYAHRLWSKDNPQPKPTFERVVPLGFLEAQVADYLDACRALEELWQTPISPAQLQAEMDRMARETRSPAVLAELFAALDNDPFLIAECIARPALAQRLLRSGYAFDARFHNETRRQAEEALARTPQDKWIACPSGVYCRIKYVVEGDPGGPAPRSDKSGWVSVGVSEEELRLKAAEFPPEGETSGLREEEEAFTVTRTLRADRRSLAVESLTFPKRSLDDWWAEERQNLEGDGDPGGEQHAYAFPETKPSLLATCAGDWELNYMSPFTEARYGHTAVWTGSEMIVWGGLGATYYLSGGRYDPATDTWKPTSQGTNCPDARYYHTAVWTGSWMVVWGGSTGAAYPTLGGRYDPVANTWAQTSTSGCPTGRTQHTAVWAASAGRMILWGGNNSNTGGRYDPAGDTWAATDTASLNCPSARNNHTAVWTGSVMVVWGGKFGATYYNNGGRYDPATNTWQSVEYATPPCPVGRENHTAVWSAPAGRMIVWGGYYNSGGAVYTNTGGRYDPVNDIWAATDTSDPDLPVGRQKYTAVLTDSNEMIIWGGETASYTFTNTGGRYVVASDTWDTAPPTGANCPSARIYHTAVWTGSEMIVWAGMTVWTPATYTNTGGRYTPGGSLPEGSWAGMSTGGCPSGRQYHTAVWTGTEMIIWGGPNPPTNTGSRYNPATQVWTPTSTGTGCPEARYSHTAVWTGSRMVIWGGYGSTYLKSGAQYNPVGNTWAATTEAVPCPVGRYNHTAVWTGSRMIVWGGTTGTWTKTGGRYDPVGDTWLATDEGANCPSARHYHTAVWTGSEMVVWGGYGTGGTMVNTGGRYEPVGNTWKATSTGTGCPEARQWHTAAWTGGEMVMWGGIGSTGVFKTGGLYNPLSDTWRATSTGTGCPTHRYSHSGVWTGREYLVWGGTDNSLSQNSGAHYCPFSDTWCSMAVNASTPSVRYGHTAVWTGNSMIVWGGYNANTYLNTGGIYGIQYQTPTVSGNGSNACPATTVTLSASAGASYQWVHNGVGIAGATNPTYDASVEGDYAVYIVDGSGCHGLSADHAVSIASCPASEVSPTGAIYPGRLVKSAASSTGYYLYFQKLGGVTGYNIYEGSVGTWYSHGSSPGPYFPWCDATVTDIGTGEMRAEIAPSSDGHYYLVTGYDAAAEGPSGYASSGTEIPAAQSTCPPPP